ncbi:MAG: PSP1 domain-containing protein [Desulfitobacterium sp.]
MVEVVGVRFKRAGKIYFFSTGDLALSANDKVIVETARGVEYGECVMAPRQVSEEEVVMPLKPVIRKATPEDELIVEANSNKEKEAFEVCLKKITEHQLPMKLVDVEYTFDGNKIIFSFTAEGRVDFRELVKDLASVFRTRIELRQIGVRDEAKMLGGIGSCGRVLCCSSFLGDFEPVSIRMAKDQKLSLNPTKISGICGRLMCCLKYESGDYDELKKAAQGRERCGRHCQKGDEEVIVLDDDAVVKLEGDNKPDRGPAVPVGGKGRQEGRFKKGEKYKGKSEKV